MPDQPTIAGVVSNLLFATKIEDAARAQGCVVIWPIDQAAFEAALRAGARLAIIDAGTPDRPWLDWVRAAKSDPVMQQVPIIAFGAHIDSALRKAALAAGVDRYLARANFVDDLPEIAAFAARDKTDDPCSEPLPAGAIHGLEEFNAAKYFEQHETLELVWRAELRPIRDLYRGILQIGVACLQIERGNARGALKMIDRATRWLQPFRPKCQGVEVDQLLADATQLRSELERLGSKPLDKLDRSLFPKVHYQSQA